MSTDIQRQQTQTIKTALVTALPSIKAIAARHLTPDRLLKIALAATQRNKSLLACEVVSMVRAVIGCAELGLEPNALGHAYLVPFKNQVQLIIGYRGLVELAYRSGQIKDITCECVFEGDEFEYALGTDTRVSHIPRDQVDPKKITHAYAVIRFASGGQAVKVMTRAQIERIRAGSPAGNKGPWVDHYGEMARKTVLRNAMKYVPMSIELRKAEASDYAYETGDLSALEEFEAIDVQAVEHIEPADKGADALKGKLGIQSEPQTLLGDEVTA